jgi:preprotein translocase subunit SecE
MAMSTTGEQASKAVEGPRGFGRIALFYRQVVSELRKVVWPTRKELITYTNVVLVFVTTVIAIVSLFDLGLTKLIFWIFG